MRLATLLLALLCAAAPLHATHQISFGVDSSAKATNFMAGNPPLPMLNYGKGKYQLTVQPYLFSGEVNFSEQKRDSAGNPATARDDASFKGLGGGASFSYGLADRWGAYGFVLGSGLTSGNFVHTLPDVKLESLDASASYTFINAGVVRQFYGSEPGGFSLPVFGGPALLVASYSQRTRAIENGAVAADWDIKGSQVFPALLVGAQAGINVGRSLKLNPFLIIGQILNRKLSYTVTSVRVNPVAGTSSKEFFDQAQRSEGEVMSDIFSLGANIIYKPWGLSLNVTSPLMQRALKEAFREYQGLEMSLFTLSVSFGTYDK